MSTKRGKHRNDGNHGKNGMIGGNGHYNRARLNKLLDGKRVGNLYAKRHVTMGRN